VCCNTVITHLLAAVNIQTDIHTYRQCCCQELETQGQGQGLDVQGLDVQLRGLENWSSRIVEDKDFHRGQLHCCEAVRWDRHELEPDWGTMANKPPIRHSVIARRWCLIFRMLRNRRKFSRTWTSEDEDEDKDEDFKIGPWGSSRTRTFLEDNTAYRYVTSLAKHFTCKTRSLNTSNAGRAKGIVVKSCIHCAGEEIQNTRRRWSRCHDLQ